VKFDVITIFPDWFTSPLETGLLGKALAAGLIEVVVHDLRQWGIGPHRKVDDPPFGGGPGMVMTPGPLVEAIEAVRTPTARVVLLSAAGKRLDQKMAGELANSSQIVLVCGRYEGMDDRVRQVTGAEEISIGDFVLAGGEVGAAVFIEAVSRLVPGLMGNQDSLGEESFSAGLLEYPQYTRPANFRGIAVPEELLSGDHARIAKWRRQTGLRRTFETRPDLLEAADLPPEDHDRVKSWKGQSGA